MTIKMPTVKMPTYKHPDVHALRALAEQIHADATDIPSLTSDKSLVNKKRLTESAKTELAENLARIKMPNDSDLSKSLNTMSDASQQILSAFLALEEQKKNIKDEKPEYTEPKFTAGVDYDSSTHTVAIIDNEEKIIPLTQEQKRDINQQPDTRALTEAKEYTTERSRQYIDMFKMEEFKIDNKSIYPKWNEKQIAAFLGNLHQESNGFTAFDQIGGGGGIGDAQWTFKNRKNKFRKYASDNALDIKSFDANSGFIIKELLEDPIHGFKNKEFFNAWYNPNATLAELTQIAQTYYFRAGTPNMKKRIDNAEAYYTGFEIEADNLRISK